MEDFQKVPLLRDRLYLEELRLINEELQFRRDTTPVEGEAAVVSTGQNLPTFVETSIPQPRSRSRVVRPVLLREDASSSRFATSNLHSTPSTRQTQPLFNLATSAFNPRRPTSKSRTPFPGPPATLVSSETGFATQTLRNLLLVNDFLTEFPVSVSETAPRKNSHFRSELNSNLSLSSKPSEKYIRGLYPVEAPPASNEVPEDIFPFEKAPKINPTLRVGNLDRIAPLTRRKSKIALLRAAATPLSAGRTPLTGPKVLKPNLKLVTKSPSIMEDIVDQFDSSPGDFGEELGEIVDSNYAELSDNELVDEFLAEPGALQQSSQIALLSAITDVTTQVLPVPTITRAQQLENLFNTRMSGGINLNSALVVLDSFEIRVN